MLLEKKNVVIYGAGGSIGSVVSRAFAREGARVFLAGRTLAKLDKVAEEIRAAGGAAETARVDALDEEQVDRYVDAVAEKIGNIDISFNLIFYGDVHGTPLVDMTVEDFARPITTAVRTQFLTTRAAARHMLQRGSGVILACGGSSGGWLVPEIGGTQVAFEAVEALRQQWASELSPHGIRVVTLRLGGVAESIPEDWRFHEGKTRDDVVADLTEKTLLKRTATLADVAEAAVFVASDRARTMTATALNISCGAMAD